MKKQLLFKNCLLLLVSGICFASCKSGTNLSHQDTLNIQQMAFQKFLSKPAAITDARTPFDQRVATATIQDCITDYQKQHPNTDANATWAVGFQSDALNKWITDITTNPNIKMDNIRIFFGNYTSKFLTGTGITVTDPQRQHAGRLTVFLCPYLGNNPAKYNSAAVQDSTVDSFNLGSLYP